MSSSEVLEASEITCFECEDNTLNILRFRNLSPHHSHPIYNKMRAWSAPFIRPMAPFLAGGVITFYLINAAQEAALKCT